MLSILYPKSSLFSSFPLLPPNISCLDSCKMPLVSILLQRSSQQEQIMSMSFSNPQWFWDSSPWPLRPSPVTPLLILSALSILPVSWTHKAHSYLREPAFTYPLPGMPDLQIIMWLLLTQHLSVNPDVTFSNKPSLTLSLSLIILSYCHFIFLPELIIFGITLLHCFLAHL